MAYSECGPDADAARSARAREGARARARVCECDKLDCKTTSRAAMRAVVRWLTEGGSTSQVSTARCIGEICKIVQPYRRSELSPSAATIGSWLQAVSASACTAMC